MILQRSVSAYQQLAQLIAASLVTLGLLAGCEPSSVSPQREGASGSADSYSIISGATLRQAAPGLLANDAAGDTATVRLASPPSYGQVTIEPDGAFVYEPKWRFNGRDSFSYQIINGDVISEHIWVHITHPNVVVVLVDDLGLGDVSIYNPREGVDTPNIDALANAGVYFDQAHSTSAVCSPTRYSMLTGNYPHRGRIAAGIYDSYEPATMIVPGQETLGDLFNEVGYQTAFIGKLHNGGMFHNLAGDDVSREHRDIDFTRPFDRGPTQFGFDYSFVLPGGLSGPPYAYFENDRLVRFDAASASYKVFDSSTEALDRFVYVPNTWAGPHNNSRLGSRGWALDNYDSSSSSRVLTRKALQFFEQASARNKRSLTPEPFFLFFAPPQLHRPYSPPQFFNITSTSDDQPATSGEVIAGSTSSDRGDVIRELDLMLGALLDGLEANGQLRNTLIIFTSDNGPFPWPDLEDMNHQGVDRGVPLRGYKGQIHEGGHRVPLIAVWGDTLQSQITAEPGTRNKNLVGLHDLSATFYQLLGLQRPAGQANDSKSFLAELTGAEAAPRDHLIVQGEPISAGAAKRMNRAYYSYAADGSLWKLIVISSSTDPLAGISWTELYNLTADPGESSNLISEVAAGDQLQTMQGAYLQLIAAPQTIRSFEQ